MTAADLRRALAVLLIVRSFGLTGCESTGPADKGSLAISVATRRTGVSPSRSSDVVAHLNAALPVAAKPDRGSRGARAAA